jgi:hypothetical protein
VILNHQDLQYFHTILLYICSILGYARASFCGYIHQFARIEILNRAKSGNACCKGAYNSRSIVLDSKTNIQYNFSHKGDNVHHEILLPAGADKKFSQTAILMNKIERTEKKSNSQLLKDSVIALPNDFELNLEDIINITREIIDEMGWVKNGLAVQIDIHAPHDGETNWHAHLLVTTRRFSADGKELGEKARDLNPDFFRSKKGNLRIVPEEEMFGEISRRLINRYCAEHGYDVVVDPISVTPGEHVGPRRMRAKFFESNDNKPAPNQNIDPFLQSSQENLDNNEPKLVSKNYRELDMDLGANSDKAIKLKEQIEIDALKLVNDFLEYATKHHSVFSEKDLSKLIAKKNARLQKSKQPELAKDFLQQVLASPKLLPLFSDKGQKTELFTTSSVRAEEEKLLRLSQYVEKGGNVILAKRSYASSIDKAFSQSDMELDVEQKTALNSLLFSKGAIRILRGWYW